MQRATEKELQKLKKIIYEELLFSKEARGNDNHLYYLVCERVAAAMGLSVYRLTFAEAFCGAGCGLPRYESVVRMRRMVQREHPNLQPRQKVRRGRKKQEADFVEFARRKGKATDGKPE